ncbi:hypothetical protein Tco_0046288 [Tanacetum coccineum]
MKQDKAKLIARDESYFPTKNRVKIWKQHLRKILLMALKGRRKPFSSNPLEPLHIFDVSPKVENQEFVKPPSSTDLRDFIYELGYKGTLSSSMYHKKMLDNADMDYGKSSISNDTVQTKFVSQREGLPIHTVADDGLLERLKFISKGDFHQTYGKPIPNTWITDDIRKTETYKTYFKCSTGLIPPKKSRGRAIKEVKTTTTTQKPIKPRKKQVLCDKSPESERELENRPVTRKIRTPRAVASKCKSRFQHKTGGSSEGAGLRSEVPDEQTGKSVVLNEEKNKDKIEDDFSEKEEDEEERFSEEENVDEESEEETDDDNRSFDITNTDDARTESDSDDHEISKDGKNAAETEEEETANFEHEEDVTINKEITSMLDIEILQMYLWFQNDAFHEVKVHPSQSYQTADVHKILYDGLVNSYLLDKDLFESYGQTVSLKRNREEDKDEDPSAGINQGKETKKRRTGKETEYSKKSSTPKESTKGKPASKSSKTDKSASTDKSLKEPEHEVQMDGEEPTFENVANDDNEPQVDPKPKIQKKHWFKDSSKNEVLDPEWNTVKVIDDTPKQLWFNQMVKAVKPPLTFDKLMSTPIDFSAFAMNRL